MTASLIRYGDCLQCISSSSTFFLLLLVGMGKLSPCPGGKINVGGGYVCIWYEFVYDDFDCYDLSGAAVVIKVLTKLSRTKGHTIGCVAHMYSILRSCLRKGCCFVRTCYSLALQPLRGFAPIICRLTPWSIQKGAAWQSHLPCQMKIAWWLRLWKGRTVKSNAVDTPSSITYWIKVN